MKFEMELNLNFWNQNGFEKSKWNLKIEMDLGSSDEIWKWNWIWNLELGMELEILDPKWIGSEIWDPRKWNLKSSGS